jgi:TPR repeat protein
MRHPHVNVAVVVIVIALLAMGSPAFGDPFEEGVVAYERGDYATAFQKWRPLAEVDLRAATNIGVMYAEGLFVRKDTDEALKWLGPAAIVGNATAQIHLGKLLAENGHYEGAAVWYRRAADQGQPNAQILLGLAYADGQGVPQDYVSAYMWLNLAAAKLEPGQTRNSVVEARDSIARKMTAEQIAEAQKSARDWKPQ